MTPDISANPSLTPVLSAIHITKHFGGLMAVDQVSLDVYPNEVVGLLGDNGAGKSTFIKMISGVLQPDSGEIFLQGHKVHFSTPLEARNGGIETIYQDLALCENLDASANIFLGREPTKTALGVFKTVNRDYMLSEADKVLKQLDIRIPNLRRPIRQMSGGQRQAVAIARAVYWKAKLMIMDEPTAALGVPEQRKVLALVQTLRSQGVPVIVISHNMQDVFAVANRLVVLRRGRKVAEKRISDTTSDEVVGFMVGSGEETSDNGA